MQATFDVKSYLSLLSCPIGLDPLIHAVNLFPCCHKVNAAAAEKYYGKIIEGFCELKNKCVTCKQPVTSYAPDHTIRELATRIFGQEKDLESLPTHPLVLEEKESLKVDLPYPGLPADFIHSSGDIDHLFSLGCSRFIKFVSITPNSLLKEFWLRGNLDGTFKLTIIFNDLGESESIRNYFMACRLPLELDPSLLTQTPETVKRAFRILVTNNQIPVEHFSKLREIVENYTK